MNGRLGRNFRCLLAASATANLADGIFQVALPLIALSITRDPGAFAAVTLVGRLPWLLVALPAGALADRLDRRRTMLRVDLARVVVLGALALIVAAGHQQLWILYVVAFALGVGETLHDTAAQSVLPNVVAPDDLARANSRQYAVELTANQFVGPPLGGLLAAAALAGAVSASVAGYALAAVALSMLVGSFRPARAGRATTLRADIAAGVRYLAGHRLLRTLALCVGISNLASTAMISVLPLYAVQPGPVGLSDAGYGLLLTGFAAGSLIGAFFVERIEARLGRRRALLLAAATFPVTSLVPALTTSALVIGVSFVAASALNIGWNIITVSLRQRIVPDHLLGRVNAGYRLLAWGTMPLGAALGGVIGARFGLVAVFWTCAVLSALCLPLLLTQLGDAGVGAERAAASREPATDVGRDLVNLGADRSES